MKTSGTGAGKAQHQCLSARRIERALGRLAKDRRAKTVGENDATRFWQHLKRKIGGNREKETVALLEVFMPLFVRAIVGNGGFDLDDSHNALAV